jgi:selenocysteine-specific elongation factor
MTVVIGTAGHIDHGKTTLLRALTGIDADRLPEERRRGMTIDVGYAHLTLDDGTEIDFVDVPGHDKLVGNMLVGAGEIDAAMLVVAADDGARAQTREHLALLDALGIGVGLAVVTKVDAVEPARVLEVKAEVERLLLGTSLAGSPVLAASSVSGMGVPEVRVALVDLRDRVMSSRVTATSARLAIDRVFTVKGRGIVVTGTLRGGTLDRGAILRVVPGGGSARVREIQVHGHEVPVAPPGRTALNVTGTDPDALHRGVVLTLDPDIESTSRLLVGLRRSRPDRTRGRLHMGTAAVDIAIGRSGRDAVDLDDGTSVAILRLVEPVAVAPGDRFVLRRPRGPDAITGGFVLDVAPPRGVSRRRQTAIRVDALAGAIASGDATAATIARLDLHGLVALDGRIALATDVEEAAAAAALDGLAAVSDAPSSAVRVAVARAIRRAATASRDAATQAATAVIGRLVDAGRLVRDGDRLRRPDVAIAAPDPERLAAMDRLEAALAVLAPPPLAATANSAGCPPGGIRDLQRSGRIIVVGPDLAYAMSTYRDLTARAVSMASRAPLTPAAFRDATGTSRKYVMAILEDLDRRGLLERTPDGHVPGPRAPRGATSP